jgi:hypothetical protein
MSVDSRDRKRVHDDVPDDAGADLQKRPRDRLSPLPLHPWHLQHALVPTVNPYDQASEFYRGFLCNSCLHRFSGTEISHHCSVCSYDICVSCWTESADQARPLGSCDGLESIVAALRAHPTSARIQAQGCAIVGVLAHEADQIDQRRAHVLEQAGMRRVSA